MVRSAEWWKCWWKRKEVVERMKTAIKPEFETEMGIEPEFSDLGPGRHACGAGLYLNIETSGERSWVLRTTIRGRRAEMGLGSCQDKTWKEARQEAADLLERARKGEDILETRRTEDEATEPDHPDV